MNTARPGIWGKDFAVIFAVSFFVFLPFFLLITNITVYVIEEFNTSGSMAGLVSGIFMIGGLASRIFTGKFIEVVGRRKTLLGGLVIFFLATLLYFPAKYLILLILVRFIHGVAFGVATTAMAAIAMDLVPTGRRGEGASFYSLTASLSTAIGPLAGVLLSKQGNFDAIFYICALFSAISIIIALFLRIPKASLTEEQLRTMKSFSLSEFLEMNAVPVSIIAAIMCFTYSGILSFLTPYTKEINLMEATGLFFAVYAVFTLISRPITGRLMDEKGENFVIYPSLVVFIIGLVILSQAHNSFFLLLAAALIGIGYGTVTACFQAIAVNKSPRHRIGLSTSTFFIFGDIGAGIGPFLLGYVIPGFGYRGLYLVIAAVALITIAIYYFLHGRKEAYRNRRLSV